MRDRLIKLLKRIDFNFSEQCVCALEDGYKCTPDFAEFFADHLLAEGVIVLPCKVGQWVYVPWRWEGQQAVAMVKVEEIAFYDSQMHYMFFIDMESDDESFNQAFGGWKIGESIGETVFLTREEAEKSLAERGENGK
jgi:hypothetical protein